MKDIKAAVLLIEGTNCEEESKFALEKVGIKAELVHLKQLTKNCSAERKRDLESYDMLFIPGGWSAGDYIRAGAIFSARLKSKLLKDLKKFIDEGKLILGVCNGFQVLIELGILPGFDGISEKPEASLVTNLNGKFQCRTVYLKHENKCYLTRRIKEGEVLKLPVAHAEGRLTFGENENRALDMLLENKQVIFRYSKPDGNPAEMEYPWNPNGSIADIAAISNPEKNVLGMMPHPERVISKYQHSDWTRENYQKGDGLKIFESILDYFKKL